VRGPRVKVKIMGLRFPVPLWRAVAGWPLRLLTKILMCLADRRRSLRLGSAALAVHRWALRVTTGPLDW